eukprot:EG_transcript_20207
MPAMSTCWATTAIQKASGCRSCTMGRGVKMREIQPVHFRDSVHARTQKNLQNGIFPILDACSKTFFGECAENFSVQVDFPKLYFSSPAGRELAGQTLPLWKPLDPTPEFALASPITTHFSAPRKRQNCFHPAAVHKAAKSLKLIDGVLEENPKKNPRWETTQFWCFGPEIFSRIHAPNPGSKGRSAKKTPFVKIQTMSTHIPSWFVL